MNTRLMNMMLGIVPMDAAGDGGGGGTGGAGGEGGQGGADGGALGGQGGGTGGQGGTEGGQGGADGGALGGGDGGQPPPAEVDYAKMTDEEYLGKVKLPEGQKWEDTVMGKFAPLLRENKIAPEVFQKFVELDAQIAKEAGEAAAKKADEENKAAREAFKAAGEDFRKTFTPEQVAAMNETLKGIDDPAFYTLVTKSPLANSKTMGKMLLAYQQVYGKDDNLPTGGVRGGESDFAKNWMGASK